MGAVKMTDYNELTKHYTDAHNKDINQDVVKDQYQDAIPLEEDYKKGSKADHYGEHDHYGENGD